MSELTIEEAIEHFRKLGYNVIPLKFKEKIPIIKWEDYQTKKYEGDFSEGCNIGAICGAVSNNLVVFDFDTKEGVKKYFEKWDDLLKHTLVVETYRGHQVHFFADKPIRTYKIPELKMEIRGEKCLVVLPPSIHPEGVQYKIISKVKEPALIKDFERSVERRMEKLGIPITLTLPQEWKAREGSSYKGLHPPCIENLLNASFKEGEGRNEVAIRLASYLFNFRKEPLQYGKEILEAWDKNNQPPLGKELESVIKSVLKHEEYNYGCYDSILDEYCDRLRCEIGEYKIRKEAIEKAKYFAEHPEEFVVYLQQCLEYRLTGEYKNRLFIAIVAAGGRVKTTIIRIEGPNAVGKNTLVRWLEEFFGPENVVTISSATVNWLKRKVLKGFNTQGKIIILHEERGDSGNFKYNFEQIYSEDKIRLGFNIRGENGEWEPIEVELKGPLCFITTSTELEESWHAKTREWTIVPDDSLEQTMKIKEWEDWRELLPIEQLEQEKREIEVVKAYFKLLKPRKDYRIPFIKNIQYEMRKVEDRRKYKDFKNFLKYVCHFFQYALPIDPEHDIVFAMPWVFDFALAVADDIIFVSRGGLTPSEEKLWDYISAQGESLYSVTADGKIPRKDEKPQGFMRRDLDDANIDVDKTHLNRLLNGLNRKGYLSKIKEGSGRSGSVYKIQNLVANKESLKQALLPKISPFSADLLFWPISQIIYGTPLNIDDPKLSWLRPFIENGQLARKIIWQDLALFSPKWAQNEPFLLATKNNKNLEITPPEIKTPLKEDKKQDFKKLVEDEDIPKEQESQCGVCGKTFSSLSELVKHIKDEHKDE